MRKPLIALNCRGPRGDAKTKFLLVQWFSGVWTKLDARTRFCLYGKYTATLAGRVGGIPSEVGARRMAGSLGVTSERKQIVLSENVSMSEKLLIGKCETPTLCPLCGRCLVAHHGNSTPCGTSREHTINPKHAPKIKQAIRAKIIACIPNHLDRL